METLASVVTEGLARHGAELSDIIRVVMFVADMVDFAGINAAYVTNFGANPPSRYGRLHVTVPSGAPY